MLKIEKIRPYVIGAVAALAVVGVVTVGSTQQPTKPGVVLAADEDQAGGSASSAPAPESSPATAPAPEAVPQGPATQAPGTTSPTTDPLPPQMTEAPEVPSIGEGDAEADPGVGQLQDDVALEVKRNVDGAVSAFTDYAIWLVASPAATAEPELAVDVVASDDMNAADAEVIEGMARDANNYQPLLGGYRVLAVSGPDEAPAAVMVETIGPFTHAGTTRWLAVGGVAEWSPKGWVLSSMSPREVQQPSNGGTDLTAEEKTALFEGLGWREYANSGD